MRLEQLAYFVKIADTHSLTAASTELFISQQALSTSIKNLESEFHTQFFVRTPRGMALSNDGKYFYETAVQILDLSKKLYSHFSPDDMPSPGSLRIALNKKNKNHFFPKIISWFYKEYPQYNIIYDVIEKKNIINAVLEEKVDLGVISLLKIDKKFVSPLPEELTFIPFHFSDYALLTSLHSPLANLHTISMETIIKYPVILAGESDLTNDLFYQLVTHYASSPDIIWADSFDLQTQMVADNIGNCFSVRKDAPPSNSVCKIPITNHILIVNGFLMPSASSKNPLRDFFIEKSKSIIAKDN